ncbi:MAG: hypothetical protein HC892_09965 [Saprospiraceae bacterium]|nr:hypothetical protein [Saprospiraceae bacterium]
MNKLLELYIEKQKVLITLQETEKDDLKIVDNAIELFYLTDTIENMKSESTTKDKKFISKEDAIKAIDAKTKKYNKIIGLLEFKVKLLESKKALCKDELEKVNYALDIYDIENEIEGKKSFVAAWVKRKRDNAVIFLLKNR